MGEQWWRQPSRRWGTQLDVRPLRAFDDPDALSEDAVAAYVAKYVTQGAAETSAGLDHRVDGAEENTSAPVSRHVRLLMATCWRLGVLPELQPLRLRSWAHTLGAPCADLVDRGPPQ
ncbi:replication initiator [Streptomyces smyrnaeus]|uniref:replication initiator n=1 Tax=Streptomyces smyrnaeus TaxID=1387713 RepID=UPI0033AF158F